jgi:hypothetical protein
MDIATLAWAGAGLAALAAFFLFVYRPWHLRWGATAGELTRAMPGDGELI